MCTTLLTPCFEPSVVPQCALKTPHSININFEFYSSDAIKDRFNILRKEYVKTIDKYMPQKLLHLTVHDAVLGAIEDSLKRNQAKM